MKLPRFRLYFLLLLLLATAKLAWAANILPIMPANDGTYHVTVKAQHKFTRNTDKLKDEAMAAATEFCAKEGKQLKIVSVTEDKSQYLVGRFAEVTLTFKALAPGDPELAPATTVAPAPRPMTTDELQTELTKLDELRKKGLLTDAEFDALKQKVLSRF